MIDLLSSSHTEEDDIYQRFNLGRGVSAGIPAPLQKDIGGTVRMNILALKRG